MVVESLLHDFEDRAARAISRRKLNIDPRDFIDLLAELGDTAAPVSQADHDFLTSYAGVTDSDLSDDAIRGIDAAVAANRARASLEVQGDSLTTQEVAELLKMAPANVRRAVGDGTLYSVKLTPGSHHRFPMWQFSHGRLIPGLREVMAALPDDYHPLEVTQFMSEPTESLRDLSPVQWLAGGGEIAPVVVLADGLSRE